MRVFVLIILAVVTTTTSYASKAATLNISSEGRLLGATDVTIGGTLYDVVLVDGSCISIFGGCDEVSDFLFTSESELILASEALLEFVTIDSPLGNFDSDAALTNGCGDSAFCILLTPGIQIAEPGKIVVGVALNNGGTNFDNVGTTEAIIADISGTHTVWAVWSPAVPVPLPAGIWLFITALVPVPGKQTRSI